MKIKHLSPSSIGTFDMCNFAFYLTYELKMRGFQNKGAAMGSVTHYVLEAIARKMVKLAEKDPVAVSKIYDSKKRRMDIYFGKAIRDYPYLDLTTKDYEQCMKWVDHILYIDKASYMTQNIVGIEKDFDLIINKNGEVVDSGIAAKCKSLGLDEHEYVEEMTGKDAFRILGFIDLIVNRGGGCLEVIDWKTGKATKTHDELMTDVQLAVYNLVCHYLYPEYKSRMVTIYYLRKKPITLYLDEGIDKTVKFLHNKWTEIKRCKAPKRTISGINKRWKCRFCSFYDNSAVDGDKQACKRECDLLYALNSKGCDLSDFVAAVKDKGSIEKLLHTDDYKAEKELLYGGAF